MKHVIFKYAWKNVSRRLRITGSLLICVFLSVFSIVLAWGTYDAIDSGIELSKSQLSADVMVYPYEVDISDVSMLYSGIAQSVYMDESVLDQLNNNYVEQISSQFYLQTLPTAGCCTATKEMRLVGVDWENDMLLHSYLTDANIDHLEAQEVIVGGNVEIEGKNTLILNMPVKIKGVLRTTGTYLDDSIIMSMDQLRKLSKINFPTNFFDGNNPDTSITCAFVKLKDGISTEKYMESIKDIKAKKVLISSTTQTLQQQVTILFKILLGACMLIFILGILSIFGQVNLLVNSQFKEAGYLKAIGVKRKEIYEIFICQVTMVGISAGIVASVLGIVSARSVVDWIHQYMLLPTSIWSVEYVLVHFCGGAVLTLLISGITVIFLLRKVAKISPQETMANGDV